MPRRHPMELSRRDFLRRAGGAAVAIPGLAAILAACEKPGTTVPGAAARPLANPDNPVELPLNADPIAADTPIETGATLVVYNWYQYIYKKEVQAFEEKFDVTVELPTFNNMEEGIQKVKAGQVKPDVFFPTTDYLSRLATEDIIQPLQHELIPNMPANVWKTYWDPGPYYDRGWRYSTPYTIYTTGVGYRRDRMSDEDAAAAGYDLLWDPEFKDAVAYYDSYRDALGMAILRNGGTDVNSSDPATIDAAKEAILQLVNDLGARLTVNGVFTKFPAGDFTVTQAWSGDVVAGQWYLPKGVTADVLGYWYPEDHKGLIGNDTIAIPTDAASPRLAHEFINFFLDKDIGFSNFANWNGYQPPFTSIQPESLVEDKVVPRNMATAVVTEDMFTQGYLQTELPVDVDNLWLAAWQEIKAGG